jgi:hypothetical protein
MSLILKQENANAVPTPGSGKGTIFLNTNDDLVVKQSDGNVTVFPTIPNVANTAIYYSNNGSLDGSNALTFNNTTNALSVTGNVTANTFNGSGAGLTSIPGGNVTGAVAYATTANSVAVGNVSGIGNIATVNLDGNASNILYGNGAFASAPVTYNNSNVATFLASFGSNTITTTGNVQVGNIIGNGQALTGINGSNVTGTVANATSAGTAGTVTTAAQPNITSVGTLTSLGVSGNLVVGGDLTVDGNLVYVNVSDLSVEDPIIQLQTGPNAAAPTSNSGKDVGTALNYYDTQARVAFMGWDVSNAEFGFGDVVSINSEVVTFTSYGNIRADYFKGNGSQLTGIITSVSNVTNGNSIMNVIENGNITFQAAGNANVVVVSGTGLTATGTIDFTGASNVSLGNIANLHIPGGTANYVLSTDGAGNLSWAQGGGGPTQLAVDSFTGDGTTVNFTLSVTPSSENYTIVGVAGTLQPKTTYSLSGNTLTFSSAPPNQAPIEVTSFASVGNINPPTGLTWNLTNSNVTMTVFNGYFVDTSAGALSVTLPSVATLGDTVKVSDLAGTAAANNITVLRNGHNIQGAASDLLVDYDNATVELIYSNVTYGWKAIGL